MICKILGWIAQIDTAVLKMYKVSMQYNYEFSFLTFALKNGDFLSDVPFTIIYVKDSYYLFAQKPPSHLEIATIPVSICTTEINEKKEIQNLDIFVLTALYITFSNKGYYRPSEVLSFIGKSKGVASQRINPIVEKTVEQFNETFTYSIFQAERFECHEMRDDKVMVFYDPRHEISENSFNLTSNKLIPGVIEKEVLQLHRNFESVEQRFLKIIKVINTNQIGNVRLSVIENLKGDLINSPSIKINSNTIETLNTTPLVDILEDNISFDPFISNILFLIDKSVTDNTPIKIQNFISYFAEVTGLNITIQSYYVSKLHKFEADAAIICIDDRIKGSGYVYNKTKEKIVIPNKIIKFSTILEDDWGKIVKLIWLNIRFRYTRKLYQNVSMKYHQNIIALHITPYYAGEWMILSGVSSNKGNINISHDIFYNDRDKNIDEKVKINDFLQKLINFSDSDHFLIQISDRQLLPLIDKISHYNFCLVLVNSSHSILYGQIENTSKAIDGLSVSINDNKSLIMTNGYPNDLFEGIPKPLFIEKIKGLHDIQEILQDVFYQTFINPYSLSKPKFPFILGLAMHYSSEFLLENRRTLNE